MPATAVLFEDVRKSFEGLPALDGLSFEVPPGSVTALLGRNACGKTTALKCLLGLLRADEGRIYALGQDVRRGDPGLWHRVGYLSERPVLDLRLSLGETYEFCRGLDPNWDEALARRLMQRFGLSSRQYPGELSQGGRRKAGLIVALAHRPQLLVLDEPAANLDVVVRRELFEVVMDLFRDEGLSVLLSTHLLQDVERVADRVVLMSPGRARVESDLDDLRARVKAIRLQKAAPVPLPPLHHPGVLELRETSHEALVTVEHHSPALLRELEALSGGRAEVRDLPLEEIFMAYVRDPDEAEVWS